MALVLREDGLDDSFAEEASRRIDLVIQELLQERGGGMVTGWVAWVDYVDGEGSTLFAYCSPEEQRLGTTVGMVRCLDLSVAHEFSKLMARGEDD